MAKKEKKNRPAGYSKNDSSESKSVKILDALIDEDRVKTHFLKRSTVPNTDGTLQLVDVEQVPIGNFDVQIKTLNEKDKRRSGFNIECAFLYYCLETATNPVLLFAVNHKEKFALWEHISKDVAKSLLEKADGDSVTIPLAKENRIVDGNSDYYEKWVEIHSSYKQLFEVVNDLKKDQQRFKIASAILNDVNSAIVLPGDGSKFQAFVDHMNNLLDREFKAVKRVFYPNTWKLGLGLFDCREDALSYTIYPIKNGSTDLQIKQLDKELSKKLDKIGFVSYYPHVNPIYQSPENFAGKFVAEKVGHFFKQEAYESSSTLLAEEAIFHAIRNDRHRILGFSKERDRIPIIELKDAVEKYLPMYLYLYLMSYLPSEVDSVINLQIQMDGYVQIDDLLSFQAYVENGAIKDLESQVRERLASGQKTELPFAVYSKSVALKKFYDAVKLLESKGVKEATRPYIGPKFLRGPYVWSGYDYDDLYSNIQKVYQNLPEIFDDVVSRNFPMISEDLKFFQNFDALIIYLEEFAPDDPRGIGPIVNTIMVITDDKEIKNKIIFLPKEHSNIFQEDHGNFTIKYLNKEYDLRASGRGFHFELFNGQPISVNIRKLLHERLQGYFKKSGVEVGWGPINSYEH